MRRTLFGLVAGLLVVAGLAWSATPAQAAHPGHHGGHHGSYYHHAHHGWYHHSYYRPWYGGYYCPPYYYGKTSYTIPDPACSYGAYGYPLPRLDIRVVTIP